MGMRIARTRLVSAVAALVLVLGTGLVGAVVRVDPATALPSVTLVSSSTWFEPIGEGQLHVVGELRNNGPGIASHVRVDIDISGVPVVSGDALVDDMYPGEKAPFDIGLGPYSYTRDPITIGKILPSPYFSAPKHNFTTTVTRQYLDSSGYRHVSGTVRNNNGTTIQGVAPVFTFYNGSTAVMAGGTAVNTGATHALSAGQTGAFDLKLGLSSPGFTRFAVLTQSTPSLRSIFTLRPGGATDIAVGASGSVWIIGSTAVNGNYGIYRWTGTSWAKWSGWGVKIAVDPKGSPWVVNSSHHIYHWNGRAWALYRGLATDVSVGANGSVWVIGTDGQIYRWGGAGWGAAGWPLSTESASFWRLGYVLSVQNRRIWMGRHAPRGTVLPIRGDGPHDGCWKP
jgi:hypothetical protein